VLPLLLLLLLLLLVLLVVLVCALLQPTRRVLPTALAQLH
jgi:hypothetical protein